MITDRRRNESDLLIREANLGQSFVSVFGNTILFYPTFELDSFFRAGVSPHTRYIICFFFIRTSNVAVKVETPETLLPVSLSYKVRNGVETFVDPLYFDSNGHNH